MIYNHAAAAAVESSVAPLNSTTSHDYLEGIFDGSDRHDVVNATLLTRPTAHIAYNDNANSWWRNFIPR